LIGKLQEKMPPGRLRLHAKTLLKWIIENWLKAASSGGLLEHGNGNM
jgi:hypothetical protein